MAAERLLPWLDGLPTTAPDESKTKGKHHKSTPSKYVHIHENEEFRFHYLPIDDGYFVPLMDTKKETHEYPPPYQPGYGLSSIPPSKYRYLTSGNPTRILESVPALTDPSSTSAGSSLRTPTVSPRSTLNDPNPLTEDRMAKPYMLTHKSRNIYRKENPRKVCAECRERFASLRDLRLHRLAHIPKFLVCIYPDCSQLFNGRRDGLKRHLITKHNFDPVEASKFAYSESSAKEQGEQSSQPRSSQFQTPMVNGSQHHFSKHPIEQKFGELQNKQTILHHWDKAFALNEKGEGLDELFDPERRSPPEAKSSLVMSTPVTSVLPAFSVSKNTGCLIKLEDEQKVELPKRSLLLKYESDQSDADNKPRKSCDTDVFDKRENHGCAQDLQETPSSATYATDSPFTVDFDESMSDSSSITQVQGKLKQDLVDKFMQKFSRKLYDCINKRVQASGAAITQCGNNQAESQSSTSDGTTITSATPSDGSESTSAANSISLGSKRSNSSGSGGRDGGDEDNEDGRSPKRLRTARTQSSEQSSSRKLACPFYKRRPHLYQNKRSCPGPGWDSVHRIKEHIYRWHTRPIQCHRCGDEFVSDEKLFHHMRGESPCPKRSICVKEGIDTAQEKKLRSRKRIKLDATEEEKWSYMYRILFPDDDQQSEPSPYYEIAPTPSSSISNWDRYHESLRFDLPAQVRREIALEIEREMEPLEERLRSRLPDIVQAVHRQLCQRSTEAGADVVKSDNPSESVDLPGLDSPSSSALPVSDDQAESAWSAGFIDDFFSTFDTSTFDIFGSEPI